MVKKKLQSVYTLELNSKHKKGSVFTNPVEIVLCDSSWGFALTLMLVCIVFGIILNYCNLSVYFIYLLYFVY